MTEHRHEWWNDEKHPLAVHCNCTAHMDENRANALEAVLTAARRWQTTQDALDKQGTVAGFVEHEAAEEALRQAITGLAPGALEAAIRAVDGEAEGAEA